MEFKMTHDMNTDKKTDKETNKETYKKTDRRYRKNHTAIREAYLDLVLHHDPHRITVKEICEKADVNRSTFYQHYGYPELLEEEVIRDRIHLICEVELIQLAHPNDRNMTPDELMRSIHRYLMNFIHDEVLLSLINSERSNFYINRIIDIQCELMTPAPIDSAKHYSDYFQNSGACSTIINWYRNGMTTPMEVIEKILFDHLILSYPYLMSSEDN